MKSIRLIDRQDVVICEADVLNVVRYEKPFGERIGHLHACLPIGATLPMWYGGSYTIDDTPWYQTGLAHIYFSLPSGHQNIWGQGNDFDVATIRIHPEDLAEVLTSV